MATGVQTWSLTPASNATADTNINWAEGMAPSAVNDSARALMASVAKWRDDNNGTLVTSGTSLAFTLVTNQVAGALTAGYTVACRFHATNDSTATLAVDGLAAAPILISAASTGNVYGQFPSGLVQNLTYSSTGTGQWIAQRPDGQLLAIPAVLGAVSPVGTAGLTPGVMMGMGTTFTYTPRYSTRVYAALQYTHRNTAVNTSIVQAKYGTGTAPANGAAAAGTSWGAIVQAYVSAASITLPVTIVCVITGLVPGTAYWFDTLNYNLASNGVQTVESAVFYCFEI